MTKISPQRRIRTLLSDGEIRQLATEIAADLFRDGLGRHADRLVMEFAGGKIDGTGWAKFAVAGRVEKILKGQP